MTRQNLPTIDQSAETAYEGVKKGAYVVSKSQNEKPEAILLASGSEVGLALDAQSEPQKEGIDVSVVSVPSWDRFDKRPAEYKNAVLPTDVTKRLAIEMGSPPDGRDIQALTGTFSESTSSVHQLLAKRS